MHLIVLCKQTIVVAQGIYLHKDIMHSYRDLILVRSEVRSSESRARAVEDLGILVDPK